MIEVRQVGHPTLRVVVFEPLEIGRDCLGLLIHDTKTSRRHARVSPDRAGIVVEDLDSSNGTWVNGRRISSPTLVTSADTLRLGDTLIEVGSARPADASLHGPPDLNASVADQGSIVQVLNALTPADLAPPVPPPHGIVTILFSDIEGSTDLVNQVGDRAWLTLLNEHNAIIRRCIRAHGGTEVKTIGDGFMITFPSAGAGLAGAIAVQRAINERGSGSQWPIRVRIGLHAGEVLRSDGDVFGAHVNIAARVAGQAEGCEILVSGLLHDLVRPVTDVHFSEPREVALKGFSGTQRVHAVRWRDTEESAWWTGESAGAHR